MPGKVACVILICMIFLNVECGKNYYQILGISRRASDQEIKAAYKRLSKQYHPDKVSKDIPRKEAEAKYADIAEAYETLLDPDKRRIFDQGGEEALKQQGGGGNPFNPFEAIFNPKKFGAQKDKKDKKDGPTTLTIIDSNLQELYTGASVDVILAHRAQCPKCSGSGAKAGGMVTCPKCSGKGVYMSTQQMMPFGMMQMQKDCEKCGGKGKIIGAKCGKCKGEGTILTEDKLTLEMERGSKHGETIEMPDMGDWGEDFDTGKLVVRIRESVLSPTLLPPAYYKNSSLPAHKRRKLLQAANVSSMGDLLHSCTYSRKNYDLHVEYAISIREAMLGVYGNITHLDGHVVNVNRTGLCTPHGFVAIVENEGMPRKDETSYGVYGQLHVHFKVTFPHSLNDTQRALVEQLFPPDPPVVLDSLLVDADEDKSKKRKREREKAEREKEERDKAEKEKAEKEQKEKQKEI